MSANVGTVKSFGLGDGKYVMTESARALLQAMAEGQEVKQYNTRAGAFSRQDIRDLKLRGYISCSGQGREGAEIFYTYTLEDKGRRAIGLLEPKNKKKVQPQAEAPKSDN